MNNPKISVIVPVYKVEKYLRRCVDSILNQTYKNLEIVLVDDGSPDNCPAICDEYKKADNRVKVIHKENGGLSSARNAALDSGLKGDYIAFVDSDDWLFLDTYEYCINLLNKDSADIIQYNIALVSDDKKTIKNPLEKISIYEGKDILQYYMYLTTSTAGGYVVWRNLFSSHLIGDIRFRVGKTGEDADWKYRVLSKANKMIVSNQIKYYYFQSDSSISTGVLQQRHVDDGFETADVLYALTKDEEYGTIRFLGEVKKARTPFSLLCRIAMYGTGNSIEEPHTLIKQLTIMHRKNASILLKAPIPLSRKVLTVLFAVNYKLTEKLIHFARGRLQ